MPRVIQRRRFAKTTLCQKNLNVSAYHQYRVWNVPECKEKYKGYAIKDKATGNSAYSPSTEEAGPLWHRKDEGEESEREEVGAAMAAVRLK